MVCWLFQNQMYDWFYFVYFSYVNKRMKNFKKRKWYIYLLWLLFQIDRIINRFVCLLTNVLNISGKSEIQDRCWVRVRYNEIFKSVSVFIRIRWMIWNVLWIKFPNSTPIVILKIWDALFWLFEIDDYQTVNISHGILMVIFY